MKGDDSNGKTREGEKEKFGLLIVERTSSGRQQQVANEMKEEEN